MRLGQKRPAKGLLKVVAALEVVQTVLLGLGQQLDRDHVIDDVANILALMAEVHTLDPGDVEPIDPLAWQTIGLEGEEVISEALEEAQQEIAEAQKLFIGN